MSFRQGARQFFEKRGATLPYDAEVEWIERDLSIDWTGGSSANNTGFNLDEYTIAGETCSNISRQLNVLCSYLGDNNCMVSWLGAGLTAFSQRVGVWAKATGFSLAYGSNAIATGTMSGLDSYHLYSVLPTGGAAQYIVDNTIIGSASSTNTSELKYFRLLFRYTTTNPGKYRIKSVRLGSDVDLIPVVKGSQMGFYNKVDGHLFLEEQACLSAGPVVRR